MKMRRMISRYSFYLGFAVTLMQVIISQGLSAQEVDTRSGTIKPEDEIITRMFARLVELLGSESAALVVLVLVAGVIGYLVKDAIPAFCKWLIGKIIGFFNKFRGRNLGAYRKSLIHQCEKIRVGYKNFLIDVGRDYVSLHIKTGLSDQDVEIREVDPILRDCPHLVVRGHPGSGKTTLLKYLAIRYARKSMNPLHGKHLIPIFVSLKDVPVSGDRASEQLFEYMATSFRPYFKRPEDYLRTQLQAGNCIVLLDGADEVRSDLIAGQLKGIEAFAAEFDKVRVVATVRKEGYEKIGFDARFKETEVAGLTIPQMETLASSVLRANQPDSRQAEAGRKCADLMNTIRQNPRLQLLAENPMLLSIIALVFDEQGDLPRKRVELYEICLNLILELREIREVRITYRLVFSRDQKYYALRKLALQFTERNESQFAGEFLKKKLKELAPVIGLEPGQCDLFLGELCKIGILRRISTFDDQYDFVHKTFLEYFAAREIKENPSRESLVFEHADDPGWREVILLYVALLGDPEPVIQTLIDREALTLAAESFLDARIQTETLRSRLIGRLSAYLIEDEADRERAVSALMEMILPRLNVMVDRAEVQSFLEGRLKDPLERMETKSAIYCAALGLEADLAKRFGERVGLVYIPAGKSKIGADSGETQSPSGWRRLLAWIKRERIANFLWHLPKQEVETPAYYLDKYPVTNRDYILFMKAGGYRDSKYWCAEGWAFISRESRSEPLYWSDERFNEADQPAVGVSWYEADAYARWAGKHLPSEEFWEKAARGSDERSYPWGNEAPDQTRCNFGGHVGQTTPVGKYQTGKSPYGAYDMAGNVWEWCDSEWIGDTRYKILRGGSWDSFPEGLRASIRSGNDPADGGYVIGFRCARTL